MNTVNYQCSTPKSVISLPICLSVSLSLSFAISSASSHCLSLSSLLLLVGVDWSAEAEPARFHSCCAAVETGNQLLAWLGKCVHAYGVGVIWEREGHRDRDKGERGRTGRVRKIECSCCVKREGSQAFSHSCVCVYINEYIWLWSQNAQSQNLDAYILTASPADPYIPTLSQRLSILQCQTGKTFSFAPHLQ